METWDVKRTAEWLCQIGLDKKYAITCEEKTVSGRALLLLASGGDDQVMSVLGLKMGPQAILMKGLEPHLLSFKENKLEIAQRSKPLKEWNIEDLCSWLRELVLPEECLTLVQTEEINGQALLLLRESGKLKESLQLKEGSWTVLEHELSLLFLERGDIKTETTTTIFTNKNTQLMPTLERKEIAEFKEPLAAKQHSVEETLEIPPKVVLSKEEQKLSLIRDSLKLDISSATTSENTTDCVVRSIFVKRGKGANALEKLFNFIVITKEELDEEKPRKLWSKIIEKTTEWMKLLPENDAKSFFRESGSDSLLHVPSGKNLVLTDGKVVQIPLGKLSIDEFKQCIFIIMVDKQLLNEKKAYKFSLDKKSKSSYSVKLTAESKYHGAFDPNRPSQDFKPSKFFKSFMTAADESAKIVNNPSQAGPVKPSVHISPPYQTPRPFNSEFEGKYYNEGWVLPAWESGSKDLITPVHEFKLLRRVGNNSEDMIKKFVYETLRFACGCLNGRTNGTIHFGVADEEEEQACGYYPRQIVGSLVTDKPTFSKKLTEFIDKCFVGDSRSNVHNCIRPPVFIPVKGTDVELPDNNRVVIEVDIEPRYSLCAGEVFTAKFEGLNRGRAEATAYIRHGSETKAIVDPQEMRVYMKKIPKLDEDRKKREQESNAAQCVGKEDSLKQLHSKLKTLLCSNKTFLDSSLYPILVLGKPNTAMNQEFLEQNFHFIQNIKWQVVIDFDDQGSDSNGLCAVFKAYRQCQIHEAEDYSRDDNLTEQIYHETHWIFANGYTKLKKECLGFKQWNNSKRKRGLSLIIQSLANTIPGARAVVLFLLFLKECEPMADTFKDFCTFLDGPNQLLYVAENSEVVAAWEEKLSSTCLEEYQLRERGVVGMSWNEFQESVEQMVRGTDRRERYVAMVTGALFPVQNVTFNNIEIVSATECDELHDKSSKERFQISSEVEIGFYRGYSVSWMNFWFSDNQKNHVLRRTNYTYLRELIEKLHSRGSDGKVHTVTIYHHIGAGASTMARQALWDFRRNSSFPFRCAVVTKINDSTCKDILHLRKIGYGEDSESIAPPVLALVEGAEDFLFRELRSQVVDLCHRHPRQELPVCVFLYCKATQNPRECHLQEKDTSVFLEQHLSPEEVNWFKDKYTDMKGKCHKKDPESDFENYASENLISFMIMKENFNPKYASNIVERNLKHVTDDELTMLKYTSLLNVYNPYPVFVSCFDTFMVSLGMLRRKRFWDWVENLSHSARVFLREMDCSAEFGTGKAIAIVHPIIACELLDHIAERNETSVSELAIEFLRSPLLADEEKSFTLKYLRDCANRMLKHRKKFEYGDDIQTNFSPLIEKILYGKNTDIATKTATEDSIDQAAGVLKEGLEKFGDPVLAQQIARVFYVNAKAFTEESKIDSCFARALTFCNKAIEMSPGNSFLFDTMGRIHESKMKVLYDSIHKDNRLIEVNTVTPIFPLAFDAIKWFQKSVDASGDCRNDSGLHGELSVMFYLLDVIRCVRIFRGQAGLKKLEGYLAYCQIIPSEVEEPWVKFHESIKNFRNRYIDCLEGLTEVFAIYKGNSLEERILPTRIANFKAKYFSYFGEGNIKWNTDSPEERWEYRWHQINQSLAGGIFSSVFSVSTFEESPRPTLHNLKKLAEDNYCERVKDHYNDLLLIITTSMALYSPYRNTFEERSARPIEEYKEIYKYVEKLFLLEEDDGKRQRLYAHLFKVMFLWPRKELELSGYRVQDFYDSLKKLKDRWQRKCKERNDTDKILKQKMFKNMSFRREKIQYTTLFYLGKGSGPEVFVHINELTVRGSPDWENPKTKRRLKRLTGIVESNDIIRVDNPLDSAKTIEVYYSSREGRFSKEEVSFFLGFSWANPIAFDVKYTNKDRRKQFAETSDPFAGDHLKFLPKPDLITYDVYTSRLANLNRRLRKIAELKKSKEDGDELDENQVTN